jgi:hypothetical protein
VLQTPILTFYFYLQAETILSVADFVLKIVPFLSFVRLKIVPFLFSTYIVEYSRANEESERRDYFLLMLWSTRAKKENERRDLN